MKLFFKKLKKLEIFSLIVLFIFMAIFFAFMFKNKEEPHEMGGNVQISMAMDDNYVYPTIVAIVSIMENKYEDTVYSFYIMHPAELSNDSKEKVLSLKNKYKNIDIELIDMGGKYKSATTNAKITTPSYYRLCLPELLPNLDKIIWLDGDTITYHDLNEMYNINMDGYYFKGFLDDSADTCKEFGIYNDHYICAGVMLLNLKELRENNMVEKFSEFISENNDKLKQHDQTVINVLCYDKIGVLPAKFGIFNFLLNNGKNYIDNLTAQNKYTLAEFNSASNDPYVLHCTSKPWKNKTVRGSNTWWKYAKKSGYYKEIKEKYYN